jgi:hypothetical protein
LLSAIHIAFTPPGELNEKSPAYTARDFSSSKIEKKKKKKKEEKKKKDYQLRHVCQYFFVLQMAGFSLTCMLENFLKPHDIQHILLQFNKNNGYFT